MSMRRDRDFGSRSRHHGAYFFSNGAVGDGAGTTAGATGATAGGVTGRTTGATVVDAGTWATGTAVVAADRGAGLVSSMGPSKNRIGSRVPASSARVHPE